MKEVEIDETMLRLIIQAVTKEWPEPLDSEQIDELVTWIVRAKDNFLIEGHRDWYK